MHMQFHLERALDFRKELPLVAHRQDQKCRHIATNTIEQELGEGILRA